MNIPTITGTTCPSVETLSRDWSLIITARFPGGATLGYLGRVTETDALGACKLEDPFEYESAIEVVGKGSTARVARARQFWPVEGFALDSIVLAPLAFIPLSQVSTRQVHALRELLVPAWDGREHIRKVGGRAGVDLTQ